MARTTNLSTATLENRKMLPLNMTLSPPDQREVLAEKLSTKSQSGQRLRREIMQLINFTKILKILIFQ